MLDDITQIHNYWMSIMFERHTNPHPVAGEENPDNKYRKIKMSVWNAIGIPVSILVYPVILVGYILRKLFVEWISSFVARHHYFTVLGILVISWSTLSAVSYWFNFGESTAAVTIASIVAVLSGSVSYAVRVRMSTKLNIIIGYPMAYTAILLPPVTFALIHSAGGSIILELSSDLVILLKNIVADPLGIRDFLTRKLDLVGFNYIILWFCISYVVGWFTGITVWLSRQV